MTDEKFKQSWFPRMPDLPHLTTRPERKKKVKKNTYNQYMGIMARKLCRGIRI